MNLAIITCQRLPNGVTEDQPLFDALEQNPSLEHQICIWDDEDINWAHFDACLLRSVWDYHEKSESFIRWIRNTSKVTKIINPPDILLWNTNKFYLKELEQAGLPIAPTLWLPQNQSYDLIDQITNLPTAKQYFLKPVIGADSSGTHRFKAVQTTKAQLHLDKWITQHDMMLQSYIPSVESYGEISAVFFGQHFSHAIRKVPVAGDYRVQDTFGAQDSLHHLNSVEYKCATSVIDYLTAQFNELCYTRVDMLVDDKGIPVINEVELIEPSLFFHHNHLAPKTLINQIQKLL